MDKIDIIEERIARKIQARNGCKRILDECTNDMERAQWQAHYDELVEGIEELREKLRKAYREVA